METQSPCCDRENGFYSHVNVSTYKSHSFLIKGKFDQYLEARPILRTQPFHVVSRSLAPSTTCYLRRKIVTLQFVAAESFSPIVKVVERFFCGKRCARIDPFLRIQTGSDPFLIFQN